MINIGNKDRQVFHNRDIKVKISLINHVQYFFNIQGIDEKVIQLLPTEFIDKNYSNLRMDFLVQCKSGNIYNIEGETQSVNDQTINKAWKYIKELMCKYENDVYSIIIALSEKNKMPIKDIGSIKFQAKLCEMKKFNGDEYLNNIKKKFKNGKELTIQDCAIIENIPDMKNSQKESIIVEQLCNIIKNGKISDKNRIKLQSTMWLNIDYYVKDKDKRNELMEMIKVQESQDQDFFNWQEEFANHIEEQGIKKGIEKGRDEGIEKGRNDIIKKLLETMSPEEVSKTLEIPLNEIKIVTK